MKRILVVNVNWLGDVIFSSPIFKALKEAYPEAHISCLAVPRVKDVLESIPYVDEIIVYDEKDRHWHPLAKLGLIWKLRCRHFDVAFLLHRSLTRALMVFFAGIPQRVGYDAKGRGRFLTHQTEPLEGQVHRSNYYLNIFESYGVKINDRQCQLKVLPETEEDVKKVLRSIGIPEDDLVIIVNPGGNWDLKRWSPSSYAHLVAGLVERSNTTVIITGAKKDVSLAKEIIGSGLEKVVDLTGKTNLKQLMALMKNADLVISGDSGPLHIADSLGTEVIGLFGPTRPEITGPKGSGWVHIIQKDLGCNRESCYHLMCPDNVCMQSITVEDVLELVKQIKDQ
ncbi:MAG: lipopolysaccharide heptosyltransferase II [Candidatus Omnitrophica bacterium]|nr:lipopolysaccharide heptosyltransferase II [Candidatus Omnitrophota bacterium]